MMRSGMAATTTPTSIFLSNNATSAERIANLRFGLNAIVELPARTYLTWITNLLIVPLNRLRVSQSELICTRRPLSRPSEILTGYFETECEAAAL